MAQGMGVGDAICIKREVIATFLGGQEGDADRKSRVGRCRASLRGLGM
jgi:hypothetical protein